MREMVLMLINLTILRDSFYCGLSYSMDCTRIMKHIRVIDNKLCCLDKSYNYINDMYEVRNKLHKQIYKHKVCLGIELMIVDILILVNEYYNINKSIMNPELFCKLDDNIIDNVYNTNINLFDFKCKKEIYKAKELINKIKNRKLYKLIDESETINYMDNNIFIVKYSLGNYNPFNNIYFYNKNNLNKKFIKKNTEYNHNFNEQIKRYRKF